MSETQFAQQFGKVHQEMARTMVGCDQAIRDLLVCFIAGGNLLIESMPGLGKTLLAKVLANVLEVKFSRIQFTPDLMPADIIGTNIIVEDDQGRKHIQFQRGPVFTHILLADEINRATPKAQSALLEVMQEHSVTVAGIRHIVEEPFIVIATQSLMDTEGTYSLPEAQLDRFFFKIILPSPDRESLKEISRRTTGLEVRRVAKVLDAPQVVELRRQARRVSVPAVVRQYASRLILATHPETPGAPPDIARFVRYGASPRGVQALILAGKIQALLAGRGEVQVEDIAAMAMPALRHRIIANYEGEAEKIDLDGLVRIVLAHVDAKASRTVPKAFQT